jgi:hypothetical protein
MVEAEDESVDEDGEHEKEDMAESFENTSYLITFIVIKIANFKD